MLIEKNVLANSVFSFIEDGCLPISNDKEKLSFKSYLKKDENNCYTIIDKDHSIKCLFDKNYLKDYMGAQPSYFKVDNFDGSLILIKKSYFDVCFYKNVNKTISVRVVLFIQEFELDIAQKIQKEGSLTVRKNVNSNPKIAQRLNIFFYKHIKEKISKEYLEGHPHIQLNAKNFLNNEFPALTTNSKNSSVEKILPKECNYALLLTPNDMYTIDEQLILQEAYSFNQNNEIKEKEENDNITVENLKMLDFGSFFHKHPSQISLGRISGDFSLSKELNEKQLFDLTKLTAVPVDVLLGNKTPRDTKLADKYLAEMPESIKMLIVKHKERKFTIDHFGKYQAYKQFKNAELYKREQI